MGGGSDDIGDVSWVVPTVRLGYPSNIPGGPGHNWANGVSMATPIAHKGVIAGAKVQAMTMLDILLHPELVQQAHEYFAGVQNKNMHYTPFVRPNDQPAIWLNEKTMATYREKMKAFYYDPSKYDNYLDQLGMFDQAAEVADRIATIRPLDPEAQLNAGIYNLLHKMDRDRAAAHFAHSLQLRPGYPEAQSFLALAQGPLEACDRLRSRFRPQ